MTPESVDELFTVAWRARPATGALAAVVRPFVTDLATAKRLCEAWLPHPLKPGEPIPNTLPTGEPLPPSRNPWGRESSPLPGVDLPRAETLELAWQVLESDPEASARTLQSLAPQAKLTLARAKALIASWSEAGHRLRCVRMAEPWPNPDGHFDDELTAELMACVTTPSRGRSGWVDAQRMLVRSGVEPGVAATALLAWFPASGFDPQGFWVQPHLVPRASTMPLCPGGTYLSEDDSARVRQACQSGQPGKAAEIVRRHLSPAWPYVSALAQALERERHGVVAAPAERPRGVLDSAIEQLLVTRPLHWALLARARIVEDPTVPTMAVGFTRASVLHLFFNPRFVASISQEELQGVLCHEINHVIFGHLEPPPLETAAERAAWNIACEASANEYVPFPLPDPMYTIQSLGLPPDESTYDRYHRLLSMAFEWVEDSHIVLEPLNDGATHHGDVIPDRSPPSADAAIAEAVQDVTGLIDPDTRKAVGRAQPRLISTLTPDRQSALSWKELLRSRGRSLLTRQSTLKFPSRRLPALVGIVAGRRSRRTLPIVLAAIDTSASMSLSELNQVSGELSALLRMRIRVACVQCDVEIQEERWLKPAEQLTQVRGRGGTDLRPPFDRKIRQRYRPDLIVYFTDGFGTAPSSPPPNVDVLWVLTGPKPKVPTTWGTAVCLRPRHQRKIVLGPRQ